MPHIVELPNGDTAEFPEDMSEEQITSAIQQHFPMNQQGQTPTEKKNPLKEMMASLSNPETEQKFRQNAQSQQRELPLGTKEGFLTALNALRGKDYQSSPMPAGEWAKSGRAGGKIMGEGAPIAAGTALGGIAGAEMGAPLIGQMLGAGVSGAATMPGSLKKRALTGLMEALMPASGKIIHKGIDVISNLDSTIPKLAKSALDKISPGKASKELLSDLGKGAANTEESGAAIVKDIKAAHDMREEEATAFLKHPLQQAGEEKIYEAPNPLISTKMDNAKSMINKIEDLGVGDLFETFKKNPTFENAHNLQSELGVLIGDLKKIPGKGISETKQLNDLKSVRDSLKNDIYEFLEKRDLNSNENLLPMYKKGSDLYRENVGPYLANKKLREITRQGKTIVNNVHDIFKNPFNQINRKTGKEEIGYANKILSDLPEDVRGKLLFNKIGGNKNIDNPSKILSSINNADQQGYSNLLSESLKEKLLGIKNKSRNKAIVKYGTGLTGAGLLEELIRRR